MIKATDQLLIVHKKLVQGRKIPNSSSMTAKGQDSPTNTLPVRVFEKKITESYIKYSTLIILGETGSGKSTQVPQIIYKQNTSHSIAITQPRRVAAISLAQRVASEMSSRTGDLVGYAVRFEERTSSKTKIKYLTDGLLLKELVFDPLLKRYSTVILDEVHERTLRTDILLGMLKDLQSHERKDLKIIIMSATMDPTKFSNFFPNSKVLNIPGRTFPVRTFYTTTAQADYLDATIVSIFQLHSEKPPGGDILVFLTGQEEIDLVKRILEEYSPMVGELGMLVCPIYAALPSSLQMQIFRTPRSDQRKIILATNIAETSITIPGIRYVVDPGYVKMRSIRSGALELLTVQPISKASAKQREGRAGREAPGECYRLYEENAFMKLDDETEPEIKRTSLSSALLLMKASGCKDVVNFSYLDRPEHESLANALEELVLLNALDENGKVTKSGRLLAHCPLTPHLSKILLDSVDLGCGQAVVTILSMLSVESIFFVPSDKREQFNNSRKPFVHASGDHMTLFCIFEAYQSRKGDARWCQEHFIDSKAMTQVLEIRNQLVAFCEQHKLILGPIKESDVVLSAFVNGSVNRVALKNPDASYKTVVGDIDTIIHPASVLSSIGAARKPEIVMFHELVQTTKKFMRVVSEISPSSIITQLTKKE